MSLRDTWNRFWFAPDAARNLAIARVLAAGTALWVLLSRERAAVSGIGTPFWAAVEPSTRWRFLLFPGHAGLERALVIVTAILLCGALFGIGARACAFAAGLLLYHIAPLESIIWTASPVARGLTLPTLALLVCGMTPSADATVFGRGPSERSWRYGWPLRLLQLWLAGVYVISALGKLRVSGLAWTSASNLSHWFRLATQNPLVAVHTLLGTWMAAHPLLTGAAGIGTLAFEWGMILAVVSKPWRPWLAGAALLFHLGIYLTMNITLNSWPLLLVFFDWDPAVLRLTPPAPKP
jgi:hypothetical protein